MDKIKLIEQLSKGYSTQAKTANQFWLVLIVASMISLTGKIENNKAELPFAFGKVNLCDFYTISIILISILIIAFTSAMIQTIRTRMLIEKQISKLDATEKFINGIHIKDIVDSILTPTYSRVAPISQFILGKNQFLGGGLQNKLIKKLGILLYIILKISSFILIYIIPIIAIKNSWRNYNIQREFGTINISNWILLSLIGLASICTLILSIGDFKYLIRVVKRINQ